MSKIVFVNRYFYPDHSATSQMLTDLARDLVKSSANIHIVTSRQRYDDPNATLPSLEEFDGIKIHRVATSRFGRRNLILRSFDYVSFYLSSIIKLLLLVDSGDTLVCKTDPPLLSVIGWAVSVLKRAKLVNWLQDLYPEVAVALELPAAKLICPLLRWIRNLSLRNACVNVAIGRRMESMLRNQGIAAEKIVVIHNWANENNLRPVEPSDNPVRFKWELSGSFVVGYSGNMGRVHDFDTVIDAIKIVEKCHLDIKFLLIGGGARQEKVAHALSKVSNVIFRPYQDMDTLCLSLNVPDLHIVSLLPVMEGLIVPSKFYGIAAVGRPTLFVGDENGEIATILKEEVCGYVARSGNPDVVASRIKKCYQDRNELLQKGSNARIAFEHKFSRSIAISKWRNILLPSSDG